MSWIEHVVAWVALGLITYAIKLVKYKENWKEEGNRVFFIAVLVAAILFGPIGFLVTMIRSKGKPL